MWCCTANIKLNDAAFFRIVRHRVGANHRLSDFRLEVQETELLPVAHVLFVDIKVCILNQMRRTLELHITAGAKIHILAFRQFQRELLDKGGHIGVGLNRTLPLLNPEHFFGNLDLHILLDRGLAGQAPAFACLTRSEVRLFSGQQGTTAFTDYALALGTATAAATGRGKKQLIRRQRAQQFIARRYRNGLLAIDFNIYIARTDQTRPRDQYYRNK